LAVEPKKLPDFLGATWIQDIQHDADKETKKYYGVAKCYSTYLSFDNND
jgi:hypothetical protein